MSSWGWILIHFVKSQSSEKLEAIEKTPSSKTLSHLLNLLSSKLISQRKRIASKLCSLPRSVNNGHRLSLKTEWQNKRVFNDPLRTGYKWIGTFIISVLEKDHALCSLWSKERNRKGWLSRDAWMEFSSKRGTTSAHSLAEQLTKEFLQVIRPGTNVCIDETIFPTSIESILTQHVERKLHPDGILIWLLCCCIKLNVQTTAQPSSMSYALSSLFAKIWSTNRFQLEKFSISIFLTSILIVFLVKDSTSLQMLGSIVPKGKQVFHSIQMFSQWAPTKQGIQNSGVQQKKK